MLHSAGWRGVCVCVRVVGGGGGVCNDPYLNAVMPGEACPLTIPKNKQEIESMG